jgi:hypothetical protein
MSTEPNIIPSEEKYQYQRSYPMSELIPGLLLERMIPPELRVGLMTGRYDLFSGGICPCGKKGLPNQWLYIRCHINHDIIAPARPSIYFQIRVLSTDFAKRCLILMCIAGKSENCGSRRMNFVLSSIRLLPTIVP